MKKYISFFSGHKMKPALIIALSVLLGACILTPKYTEPDVAYTNSWSEPSSEEAGINLGRYSDQEFWDSFQNEELTNLITTGLENNYDLSAALQRIDQARAQVRIAGANLYPQASASGNASYTLDKPDGGSTTRTDSFFGSIDISYELDL